MRRSITRGLGAVALLATLPACSSTGDQPRTVEEIEAAVRGATIPASLAGGESTFNANCAVCHGERALGTDRGPPLVHIHYEPNHHADIAFHMAVERGVRAHHWSFGDMPPIEGVDSNRVDGIVAYVRFLQREGGIY